MSNGKAAPWWIVPLIILLGLDALYIAGARHPSVLSPRPRITTIPQDDPSVLIFKKFATDNKLDWRVQPDDIDGTSYCAQLMTGSYGVVSVGCRDTLGEATKRAIDVYESQKLRIGSK